MSRPISYTNKYARTANGSLPRAAFPRVLLFGGANPEQLAQTRSIIGVVDTTTGGRRFLRIF